MEKGIFNGPIKMKNDSAGTVEIADFGIGKEGSLLPQNLMFYYKCNFCASSIFLRVFISRVSKYRLMILYGILTRTHFFP